MKILVLNQKWFVDEWRSLGHDVLTYGMRRDLDVYSDTPFIHIDSIVRTLPNNFVPDVIVYLDNSMPMFVRGIEQSEIPSLFYSVDAHHHIDQHKYWSLMFDYTLVAQRDYLPHFSDIGSIAEWLPLWASHPITPESNKKPSAIFVGNLDRKLHPERTAFLDELSKLAPVEYQMGEFWNIFPKYEVVLNQTVKGDLNFRVFEAMSSGSCLLTEKSAHGLFDLFNEGEHLVSYSRGSASEAADRIRELLNDPPMCHRIGEAGRAEILAKHTESHRAAHVLGIIKSLRKRRGKQRHMAAMYTMVSTALRTLEVDRMVTVQALAAAMSSAHYALLDNETINDLFSSYMIIGAFHFDRLTGSHSGQTLIAELSDAFPNQAVLKLAHLRNLYNQGSFDAARSYAAKIDQRPAEELFALAEEAIFEIIRSGEHYSV